MVEPHPTASPVDMKGLNFAGNRRGRLLVIDLALSFARGRRAWWCRCDCGNYTIATTHDLESGDTTSCGCRQAEAAAERCTTHGQARRRQCSAEYRAWSNMIDRCENQNTPGYADYGGRGITICREWRASFAQFFADVGSRPDRGYSLDRIEVNKGYEPGNVRWATRKEQNNNRRTNVLLTHGSETKTISQWAAILGMTASAIEARIARGWSLERTLSTPRIHDRRARTGRLAPEFTVWCGMRYRCTKPTDPAYQRYGGRGIKVCERWLESFAQFLADVGPRPTKAHRLERRHNDGDYCPDNCVWATIKEQANNRRSNVRLTYKGVTQTVAAWAEQLGVTRNALRMRLRKGMSVEDAIETPFARRRP